MAEASSQTGAHPRTCPQCGTAVQERQRRCTNCGTSVDQLRRRMPRRTPLIAALTVGALGAGAAVVAQAAVTEQATVDVATADTAGAPVPVAGNQLPEPERRTYTPPKPPKPPASTDLQLDIPAIDDTVGTIVTTPTPTPEPTPTPTPTPEKSNPDDLVDAKTLKVKKATNYDPLSRVGAEFGSPKAAIDKRSRTVWDVNVPADGKPMNVGIVLDLGETKRATELKISTPTPGFGAIIARADSDTLPPAIDSTDWTHAATLKKVSDDLTVPLTKDGDAKWTRYIVVFITTPPGPTNTRVAISTLKVLP